MDLLNILTFIVYQISSVIFVIFYLLGILDNYSGDKNNYCVMTYMYEYPQYVKITIPENKEYPQYGLHAYSEGRFTEKSRKMWYDGVPVLFIPGNSGSHMQVRSLASVALRKALTQGNEYHFDFFTISYNEELSGLDGGVIAPQTKFAGHCVAKILSLYKRNKYAKSVPNSVIVIGHSMGGLIARRLLTFHSTSETVHIAISLAAPLDAPIINIDSYMNVAYSQIASERNVYLNTPNNTKEPKLLLSFGSGPRDILMPSGLTSSDDSFIGGLTTAIPGVWVSPDHVGIVWCKQLVMVINRFLFDIIDEKSFQVSKDNLLLRSTARKYFQANRSMILNPKIVRPNATMVADAFWYEENRRVYQISRPSTDEITYLMIRLVRFPQNRFAAIEAVDTNDKDWLFGCNAKFTYNTHRYCKHATSLTELSRWTGAAMDFGKRKLATIHLHSIMEQHPDWSHVIVKVSPTKKPITLNVDTNDLASRQITVVLSEVSSIKTVIVPETEPNSLYYELIIPGFNRLIQGYLLYIEPKSNCRAPRYHVSAELHVPWAKNHEMYHYFTHLNRSPMRLRLFKSNPNTTLGLDEEQHVKITVLLDPQCQFTISMARSWYIQLGQWTRNFTPLLLPYIAAIVLLIVRANLMHLNEHGTCISLPSLLMSEQLQPHYLLVLAKLCGLIMLYTPGYQLLFEGSCFKNQELHFFLGSVLVFPMYMIALTLVYITAIAIMALMLFSSQLVHRLFLRIIWRGSSGLADNLATVLHKGPLMMSATLVVMAVTSCGASSLVVGAVFYAFKISKMYEEYLDDYLYGLMAKVANVIGRLFRRKTNIQTETTPETTPEIDDNNEEVRNEEQNVDNAGVIEVPGDNNDKTESEANPDENIIKEDDENDIGQKYSNLNFHMMMFFMWLAITLINIPAIFTWAGSYKYHPELKFDASFKTSVVMAGCSAIIWQINGPRKNLQYYEAITVMLFTMALFIILLGPFSLTLINYNLTAMFASVALQQIFDWEKPVTHNLQRDDGDTPHQAHRKNRRRNVN